MRNVVFEETVVVVTIMAVGEDSRIPTTCSDVSSHADVVAVGIAWLQTANRDDSLFIHLAMASLLRVSLANGADDVVIDFQVL